MAQQHLMLFVAVLGSIEISSCLECLSCTNISDVSECNTTRICDIDMVCYYERIDGVINMGCTDRDACHQQPGTLVGRSVTRELSNARCIECCSSDWCNDALCNYHELSECVDSEYHDCAWLDSISRVCEVIDHAKDICPQFCDLCHLVFASWTAWSDWSACDVTCGNGTITRNRTCTSPNPEDDGTSCSGSYKDRMICGNGPCPVHGGWSVWSEWGTCSSSCGVGIQRRDRSCSNPYPDRYGDHCFGDARDDRICMEQSCTDGGWSAWSGWDECSTTCGPGLQHRQRACDNPVPSVFGQDCDGNSDETNLCMMADCDNNDTFTLGSWASWSDWGECSMSCGIGLKKRYRQCDGHICAGDSKEIDLCIRNACAENRIDGGWGNWASWGGCSVTCGTGLKHRHRVCDNPEPSGNGRYCFDASSDVEICTLDFCFADGVIINGAWSDWLAWGACSVTCATGIKHRNRTCSNPPPSVTGQSCYGDPKEEALCETGYLCDGPINGSWSKWSDWGECSKSCGIGLKARTRTCNNPTPSPLPLGDDCPGEAESTDVCHIINCEEK